MKTKNDRAAWLEGGDTICAVRPEAQKRPHRFMLLGAPGAGKGTQAELLCKHLGVCHLSTGDIFRAAKNSCNGTRSRAMTTALDSMKRGELVSDAMVLALVRERSRCMNCGGGFLLDGFPRTVAQAKALEKILGSFDAPLEAVLSYELPLEKIIARLGGRRTCPGCRAVFHTETLKPQFDGICDHCGKKLVQREDDCPEFVRVRMDAYLKSTAPLTEFYSRRGLLVPVSAEGKPEQIFGRALAAIKERQPAGFLENGSTANPQPEHLCVK